MQFFFGGPAAVFLEQIMRHTHTHTCTQHPPTLGALHTIAALPRLLPSNPFKPPPTITVCRIEEMYSGDVVEDAVFVPIYSSTQRNRAYETRIVRHIRCSSVFFWMQEPGKL